MGQVGIPLFYLQELSGIITQFKDKFNDNSIFWGWNLDEVGAGRTIEETALGKLLIAVTGGTNAIWRNTDNLAPKTVMGTGAYPVEIIAKMSSVALLEDTQAGLYISENPTGTGSQNNLRIGRLREAGFDGLVVNLDGYSWLWNQDGITDSPIWFRLRVSNFCWTIAKIIFGYSVNGSTWIDVYTGYTPGWFTGSHIPGVGLFATNDLKKLSLYNAVSASFDYFNMKTRTPNL